MVPYRPIEAPLVTDLCKLKPQVDGTKVYRGKPDYGRGPWMLSTSGRPGRVMTPLPIDDSLPRILAGIREHRALVLVAPPGAGKTTRVPPAIVRSDLLSNDHPGVIVLQPRRVAARTTAARIAHEQNWKLGEEVGYQVRMERRISRRTRLRIQTEGILNRQLLADPFLEGIGAVVLDEFHERSLHSDLALALLREVRRDVRPDLIVVVMSATLDAQPVARFLDDCPVVTVEGRSFPIEIEYRGTTHPGSPQSVVPVVRQVLDDRHDMGHILVFLPGMAEIRRVQREIEPIAAEQGAVVLPLHGSLPAEDQDLALRPGPLRKIILATNIAETSLTIDGVSTVIDSGLARTAHYDPQRGFDRLDLGRISQASAAQRTGRAGRTGPGRCVRLWSEREQRGLAPFELPEIQRVDLREPCWLSIRGDFPTPGASTGMSLPRRAPGGRAESLGRSGGTRTRHRANHAFR